MQLSAKVARALASANDHGEEPLPVWTHQGEVAFGDGHVQRFELGNGLRLLALEDHSAPVASYFTWLRVGSRHERKGKTGLAHLFEHLMFNESEGLAAGEFDRRLEEAGAESNAATWLDWTYYYESVPADRLPLVIELEATRLAKLIVRDPQVTSEKEVVANERRYRVEDDVEGAANELLYATAFTVHPYHWPTIGWMKDIEGFTTEDCREFHSRFYAPNNATLIVVGDFALPALLRRVRAAYGAIARAELPAEDTHPEPPQRRERRTTLRKPTPTEKVMVGYRGPALGDADHPALTVLSEILFGGRASRLHQSLVETRELVSELRGWASTFRDPGLYEMYFSARAGVTAETILAAVDAEIARARDELVSEEELERAVARLELALVQSLETNAGKAEQIGFYDCLLGDPAAAFRRLEAYRRTTRGDVRTVARRYLQSELRTVVHVQPEAAKAEVSA